MSKSNEPAFRTLTDDQYFDIAKIIDNEFIGTRKTFTATKFVECVSLTTNKCDWASIIHLNTDGTITRVADDTNGFEKITEETMNKVSNYISRLDKTEK